MEVYEITGKIRLLSGLHIGAGNAYSAIGAVDSQVIRDPITRLPIIPGSSLKGKLRSLVSRFTNERLIDLKDEPDSIKRLFGTTESASRLIFRDLTLSNWEDLESKGLDGPTEVKYENSIGRLSAIANPRQIERVVRGSEFDLEIIYTCDDPLEIEQDLSVLKKAFQLLTYNYLGGHGSRGSGRIEFDDLSIILLSGKGELEIDEDYFNDVS